MRQLPLAIPWGADSLPDFDNFVPGSNGQAVSTLRDLSRRAGSSHASSPVPIFLWGPEGAGKTHLLRALATQHESLGGAVRWLDGRDAASWRDDSPCTLAIFDDCDAFDEVQQHDAFALFVDMTSRGGQVVAAAKVPPIDLALRDDLRTRLGWGLVFAIEPLSESQARAALRRDADRRGIVLSDEVLNYLLTRFSRDLKTLVGLLDRLDHYALAAKRHITVPLIREMLSTHEWDAARVEDGAA